MVNISNNLILVTDMERRDWGNRTMTVPNERRQNPRDITRRYMLITGNPEIRKVMEKEFRVIPHVSGIESFFLCIAPGRCRRTRKFIMELIDKLKQNGLGEPQIKSFDIFTPDKKLSLEVLRRLNAED